MFCQGVFPAIAYTPDFLMISLPPARSVKESAAHDLIGRTQQYVPSFVFDLASKAIPGFPELEILLHDKKFMQSLQKIKVKFDSKYETLTTHKKYMMVGESCRKANRTGNF